MIIIKIKEEHDANPGRRYLDPNDVEVWTCDEDGVGNMQKKHETPWSIGIGHGNQHPKQRINILVTRTNPTCVEVGGRLFCW